MTKDQTSADEQLFKDVGKALVVLLTTIIDASRDGTNDNAVPDFDEDRWQRAWQDWKRHT